MYRDEPSSHVQEMLNAAYWPDHPLGRSLTGSLETHRGIQARGFHRLPRVALSLGQYGFHCRWQYQARGCASSARRSFSKICRRAGSRSSLKADAMPKKGRVVVEQRDTQQTQFAMGLPGPSSHDPRRHALHILHVILGGNASSRLFQQLRERRGLCYLGEHTSFAFRGHGNAECLARAGSKERREIL